MATPAKITIKQCLICGKAARIMTCAGCTNEFCFTCLPQHIDSLSKELDEITTDHDQFRQIFNEEQQKPSNRSTIDEINKWEKDSIKKIKQTANECKERLIDYTKKSFIEIENKLNNLAKELKENRQENEYNEIDLTQFKQKLQRLKKELDRTKNLSVKQRSSSFINKISLILPINKDTKWQQHGITVAGGNGQGSRANQLNQPEGICIDDDQRAYVADHRNHRIIEWKFNGTKGRTVAGGHGQGNQTNQLNGPTGVIVDKQTHSLIISDTGNSRVMQWSLKKKTNNGKIIISNINCPCLTMDKNGDLYVSDSSKHEVRRYRRGEKNGIIVAGGNGQGDQLNQLYRPTYLFVDEEYSLYIVDRDNHRVMKWMKDANEGIVVAGGNGQGNSLKQLSEPQGLFVDQDGRIYVADHYNHRIVRWCEGSEEGTIVIGAKGQGQGSDQLNRPCGLSFDDEGNLYVANYGNHCVQKFEID